MSVAHGGGARRSANHWRSRCSGTGLAVSGSTGQPVVSRSTVATSEGAASARVLRISQPSVSGGRWVSMPLCSA